MKKTIYMIILALGIVLFNSCELEVSSDHFVSIDIENETGGEISILGTVTYDGVQHTDSSATVLEAGDDSPYYSSPRWTITGSDLYEAVADVNALLTLTINGSEIVKTINSWNDYSLVINYAGQNSITYEWALVREE